MSAAESVFAYGVEPDEGDFVARIPAGITTRAELFGALERALAFPYFGRNWDALWDLLNDFHWILQRRVVLVHADLPALPPDQLTTYLSILEDSIADWRPGEDHEFAVGFPEEVRERVRGIAR